ncbi:MAG: sensor histidine kinase [Armatimonadota bacterium]
MDGPTPLERWLFDNLPVGVAVLDRERRYQYVNAAYSAVQGFYAPDLLGLPLLEGPVEWAAFVAPLLDRAEATREPQNVYDVPLTYPGQPSLQRTWDATVLAAGGQEAPEGFIIYLTDVTCREQLRQLGPVEERLRSVVEAAVDAKLVVVQDGNILEANPATCRMFGYEHDELIGMFLPTLMPDEKRPEHLRGFERYLHTGVPHIISTVYDVDARRKDGSTFPCELSVAESREVGQRRIFVGILRDVTDKRRAEEELRESEQSFRQIFENASDAIFLLNETGCFLRVNRQAQRLTGYSEAELLHMAFVDLVPVDRDDGAREFFARLKRMESVAGEYLIQRCNGAIIEVEFSAARIAPERYQAILRDITERKRAEAERERLFAEIERRAGELDSILNSIADGLIIYNPSGDILRINEAAVQILGLSPSEQQQNLTQRLALLNAETPDGQPFPFDMLPMVSALRGNTVYGAVMVLHHPPDRTVWVVSSAAPIRKPDGTLLGAVATFTDITDRHALEEEREIYIHTISHDLRIPLAIIQGHVQLLQEILESTGQAEAVRVNTDAVIESVRRMNLMIKDLVDTARLESRQLKLDLRPVALRPFLDTLLERLRRVIAVERVVLEIPPDLPAVSADPDRLDRIFINLLTNALKFSAADTLVTVTAQAADGIVTIAVTDRGAGIASAELSHLFERFYRVSQTHRVEGIGLGLYIVKMLVEAHGGQIRVESEVGTGTTFYLTLPAA